MIRHPNRSLYFAPDTHALNADGIPRPAAPAPEGDSPLDATFGGMDRSSRPDLHQAEERFREKIQQKDTGKDAEGPADEAPPQTADTKPETETEPERPAEEAPPAKEAATETEAGSDLESAGENNEDAALAGIFAKYGNTPSALASAVKNLRTLQVKTAEEKKTLSKLAAIAERDYDYDADSGEFVLKPEAIQRHAGGSQPRKDGSLDLPSEDQVRAQVEAEYRKHYAEQIDADDMDEFIQRSRPMIDQMTKQQMQVIAAGVQHEAAQRQAQLAQVLDRHFKAHPKDKEPNVLKRIDGFFAKLPENIRGDAIRLGWVPIGEVARWARLEAGFEDAVREAFRAGKKAGSQGVGADVDTGGAPSGGRQGAGGTSRHAADEHSDLKSAMVNLGGSSVLGELLER